MNLTGDGAYLIIDWIGYLIALLVLPVLIVGTVKKVKARMQCRLGAPVLQLFYNVVKLVRKGETISYSMSWIFRSSAALNLSAIVLVSTLIPWFSLKPSIEGADFILVMYLLAMSRFFTMLGALDGGTAFGAFGASREASLAVLVEPANILALASLAALAGSSDLTKIFAFNCPGLEGVPILWLLAGTSLLLSSLVELSRMPVDDPTTHLELTMIHEAMILEASGRNLALLEFSYALRMTIFLGLATQCYLRAVPQFWTLEPILQALINIVALFSLAIAIGVFEGVIVKLQWRKIPAFIAYSMTMSLLASLFVVGKAVVR